MSAGPSLIQHIIILMADFVDTTKGHLQWSIGDNGFMQFSSQTHQSSFNCKVISSLSRKESLMKWVQDWFWGVGDGGGSVTCMWVCGSEIFPLLVEKRLSHETGAGLVLGVGGWGWVCYVSVWLWNTSHRWAVYTNLLNVRVSDSIWWFISHCYLNLYDFITLPCIPKPLNHMYGIYFTLSAERCSGIMDVHAAWVYILF